MKPRGTFRHFATFKKHDGSKDNAGNPTLPTDADWTNVVANVPCSFEPVSGNERTRGTQVVAETSHILVCDYKVGENITPQMKAVISGNHYGITAVNDPTGLGRDMEIQLRREVA